MTTTIVAAGQDALVSEIDIAAPQERVFKALTDATELKVWFADPSCPAKGWNMEARVGGKYDDASGKGTLVVNSLSEFECHGEILELDPPRLLVYTWVANWHDDKQRKTIVRWDLELRGSVTHVKVAHSGLAQEAVAREDYRGGWPGVLEQLKGFTEK